MDTHSISSLLFFCDEMQEWGRPFFRNLYGLNGDFDATRVRLIAYDRKKAHWEVEAGKLKLDSALYWFSSCAVKLLRKLRSAPETPSRDLRTVEWSLKWQSDGSNYIANLIIGDASQEQVSVQRDGSPVIATFGEKLREISGTGGIRELCEELTSELRNGSKKRP